jgi:hypothetical protein
VYSRL